MLQIDDSRLLFNDPIPETFLPVLRQWSREHRSGYFRKDEADLFSIAALSYADAARPTLVQVYRMLCALIDEDAALNVTPVRKPSLSTFRRIVKSLPDGFVRYRRFGHLKRITTYDLVSAAADVLGITSN
ncbi:hypothetical protein HJA90_09495 [Rhizobium bangladeshense]|uniref:hypothetical protein n=1 Tax=Rhizobium bangladeshense TaxID=1138189 RepID=UPI001C839809|nr:hypothetical protein [Rhizobium bangladeshense]MBX4883822.1 hypothetical protein [Rhizobium bangladeshense]